ncbi:4Fe-4S dicluster domain-containing protein [Chloroflexota bacterium]
MTEKEKKKKSKELSRRDFIKDAGLLVGGTAIGSTVLLGACAGETETATVTKTQTDATTKTVTIEIPLSVPKSGYISWDATKCVSCSRCMQACSTYNEGATSPTLTAIKWFEDKFFDGWDGEVPAYPFFCQQCSSPECYESCPLNAIEIDGETGARVINKDECNGCGICEMSCPLSPSRINIDPVQKKAIKCDLCKDRPEGPVCVELCARGALTLIPAGGRI